MRRVTRALLLDVDDTLIDTRAAMVAAGAAAVAALWPEAGPQVHQDAGVHFHRDPAGFFIRFTTGELGFAQMREARVADLVEVFSLKAIDEVNRRFEEAYEPAFFTNARLFDDVLPLVEAVSTAGIPMGLLTNSASHYTQQKLEITGLEGVFDVVVTRDTLGFGKPDPRAFQHACELLGVEPGETMYVGDDIEIDAIAAKDAGLYAVWLHRDAGDGPGARRAHAHGIPAVGSLKDVVVLLDGD
jgi:haloacid dehalogenase superfamily, subfamily IA, variant 3 with third motif having DD or ED/haloacid dehalogenase superfamily, subfamily IA, variant 1 with third motif having Dx(3-4)D or Dx(3-4)E